MATTRRTGRDAPRSGRGAPLVNRVLLSVLGSPARVLVDGGLCALRYRARSGETVTLPVQYEPHNGDIVVRCAHATDKRWWRHFWQPAAVDVWLDGRWQPGIGRVTEKSDDTVTMLIDVDAQVAPLTGWALFRSWLIVVSAAELAGFTGPALVGALTATAPVVVAVVALVLAGVVEGAMLGWGQSSVLRRALPHLPAGRWIACTAGGAGIAYLLGMLPAAIGGSWWAAAAVAVPLLVSIGAAQWLVLRDRVPWAMSWIWVTAAAWLVGLAVFLTFATPLWWSGQSVALTVLVGLVGGVLMATTVAAVTGLALRSFVARSRVPTTGIQ